MVKIKALSSAEINQLNECARNLDEKTTLLRIGKAVSGCLLAYDCINGDWGKIVMDVALLTATNDLSDLASNASCLVKNHLGAPKEWVSLNQYPERLSQNMVTGFLVRPILERWINWKEKKI